MIDLRVGSPTFGTWDSVELDDVNRKAVFIPEGIGHMFVVSSESAAVTYLTTDVYRPNGEFTISPVDPDLALRLPVAAEELVLSPKDLAAPSLAQAIALGILPTWDACLDVYRQESVGVAR
jgi:dTDP-4-dehydrorhamnose 3,5-epimerase